MRRLLKRIGVGLIALAGVSLVAVQFFPNSRPEANPPIRVEPKWDSPQTRALAARACFDCHSNEVKYPWYSYVAPVSWLIQSDVKDGRAKVNFSEWDLPQREATNVSKEVDKGDMPLPIYLPLHGDARLTADERQALARGLQATVDGDRPRRR